MAGKWDEMGALIDDDVLDAFAVVAPIPELARALHNRCAGAVDRVLPAFPATVPRATVDAVLDEFRQCQPVRSSP